MPSIAVVCSCQDGAARIAFQPRSCRAGWLNPHQARRRLRGSIPKTGWTPGRRSLLTSSATSPPFSGEALPPRPAESPPPVPGRGATSGAERAAAFAGLDTAPSRPDCDAPCAREAHSATGSRSRSTEDTWQRTTGSSCRPHESTTGDAGVSLTRSLSDSGPVPISLAVRAPLHLESERTTPCALPSRRCRYCHPLRLMAAALQDPLHAVCVFGAAADSGANRNPRFMRKHRSWSAVAMWPSVQLDRLGDSMYETMPWLLVWPTK